MSMSPRCDDCGALPGQPHDADCEAGIPYASRPSTLLAKGEIPDEVYLRMTHNMRACDHYRFWVAVANHLANYVAWEPLAFAIRAGLQTLPTKKD